MSIVQELIRDMRRHLYPHLALHKRGIPPSFANIRNVKGAVNH